MISVFQRRPDWLLALLLIITSFTCISASANAVVEKEKPKLANDSTMKLRPFIAHYEAKSTKIPGGLSAHRRFEIQADGHVLISNQAQAMLTKILETSQLTDNSCAAKPLAYHYDRRVFGKKKRHMQQFDWQKNQLSYVKNNKPHATLPLQPELTDRLMVQFKVRCAVKAGLKQLTIPVISKDTIKVHNYQVDALAPIELPYGVVAAHKVTRLREDSERETYLWIAPELDYGLVKTVQKKSKDQHTLTLSGLQFLD